MEDPEKQTPPVNLCHPLIIKSGGVKKTLTSAHPGEESRALSTAVDGIWLVQQLSTQNILHTFHTAV